MINAGIYLGLVLLGSSAMPSTVAMGQPAPEPGPGADSAAEATGYQEHLENYDAREIRGFTVRVNRALLEPNPERDPELLDRVLLLLEHDLEVIEEIVPAPAFEVLRGVPFWIEAQGAVVPGGMTGRGMCFHASTAWVTSHGLLAEKTGGIEIVRAADFSVWRRNQPFMTFHELAHAYHHLLGVDDEPIAAAYEAAKASGAYDAVDRNTTTEPVKAYAMANRMEYFAELSEALFGLNDFYPYSRRQLAAHDPEGLAAVEALWGQSAAEIAQRVDREGFMGQLESYQARQNPQATKGAGTDE
ncbi:MAG: hypothetical protein ACI89L_000308 [Phycisphaerales bacterium]